MLYLVYLAVYRNISVVCIHEGEHVSRATLTREQELQTEIQSHAGIGPVSWRAIIFGLLLIGPQVWWFNWGNNRDGITGGVGFDALPIMPVAFMTVLVALNSILVRLLPKQRLTRGELITLFVMLTISLAFAGCTAQLSSLLCQPIFYGAQNPAANPLYPQISRWIPEFMAPHDMSVLMPLYRTGEFLEPTIWRAWVPAIIFWVSFFAILGVVFICFNSLLYHRWAREERLEFPLTRLPLMLAESGTLGGLARNKLLLIGAGLTIFVEGINILSRFYPTVPHIQLGMYWIPQSTTPPLSYLGEFRLACIPYVIGLSFLLPVELLFSCWALYMVRKSEDFIWNAFGLAGPSADLIGFPWMREQANGAWLAVFFLVVWSSRKHLMAMAREALRRNPTEISAQAPFSPRLAFFGLIGGFIALCMMSVAAGMQLWFAAAFVTIYLIFSLTLNRMACQVGPAINDTFPTNVGYALAGMFGTRNASPESMTIMTTYYMMYRSPGNMPMSHTMYGLRYAEATKQSQKGMAKAMLLALLLALPVAMVSVLIWDYRTGLETAGDPMWRLGGANEAQVILGSFLNSPSGPRWDQITAMAVSAGFTVLLAVGQQSITNFPFHPIGWAIATIWTMICYWSTFLGVWIIKVMVLRYGGLKLYRQVVPFFLGLVLGDCLIALFIAVCSTLFGWRGISQL